MLISLAIVIVRFDGRTPVLVSPWGFSAFLLTHLRTVLVPVLLGETGWSIYHTDP